MSSRTSNTIRNVKYAVVGQGAGLFISFLSRMIFVRTLRAEYLGLDGLFSNILSILSFAELGIGSAIVYSMYRPLEERNTEKLKALMWLYKRTYIIIGIVIGGIGTLFTPFLHYVIKDMPDIPYIRVIYLMFVCNSALSYFFSYKRALIIAEQKRYIATAYRYGFYILLTIGQIGILLLTHNYFLYLGLLLFNTLIENVLVARKADQLYPFLKEKNISPLDQEEKNIIIRNVKAMVFHKSGEIIISGTDNLIISKFIGVIQVGLYSNYLIIFNGLNMVFSLMFQGIMASIGNLGVTESKEKQQFIFQCVNFAGFWIYGVTSIGLLVLINPMISLWLGEEYLFSRSFVLILIINFFLNGMRRSVLTFRDGLGIYWYDRYKPLFETVINLVVSIILVQKMEIIGVIIGTIISTITTCFWIEPYVLYKYGFQLGVGDYFKRYALYTGILITAGWITWYLSESIMGNGVVDVLKKIVVSVMVPNVFLLIVFWRSKEFQYLWSVLKKQDFLR